MTGEYKRTVIINTIRLQTYASMPTFKRGKFDLILGNDLVLDQDSELANTLYDRHLGDDETAVTRTQTKIKKIIHVTHIDEDDMRMGHDVILRFATMEDLIMFKLTYG